MAIGVPISKKVLSMGENLIVLFPITSIKDTYRTALAYVFKVAVSRRLALDWKLLSAITAGSGLDYDYLGTTGFGTGDDILRVRNNDWWVYHYGIASANPNLRMYNRIDVTKYTDSAFDYDAAETANPLTGSNYDYTSSKEMANIYDPDNEFIAFRTAIRGAGKLFKFGFYADEDIPLNSPLYLRGAGYLLQPVSDETTRMQIINEATKRPDEQSVKASTVVVGGLNRYDLGSMLPIDWTNVGNYTKVNFVG